MNTKKILIAIFILIVGFILFQTINKTNNQSNNPLPQQYLDDRTKFGQVNQLFTEAMDLTKPPDNSGKPFDMPKDQEAQILSKLETGVNLSKEIDDNFLDYLNPELKNHYRNEYVKGNGLCLEGLKGDTSNENSIGVKKQLECNQLIGEWIKWWDSHKDSITNKAFSE
ncbi:MAG: hypothetical protein V1808_01445 [Candidatus Daviesbacteria bacterium]